MSSKVGDNERVYEGRWYSHPPMRNALLAGLLTGIAFGLAHLGLIGSRLEIALYAVAIPLGAYHWGREGIEELLREHEVGIDILMMAAVVGSAILGMWDEAALLVALYGAAEGLEEYTHARTKASIRKLFDIIPAEATISRDGQLVSVPAEELSVGDTFIVKPGEAIPTDGVIVEGRSSINEAPVTGESVPREKEEGDRVFAGTINHQGGLKIRATVPFRDNTVARMVRLVEQAQEQKSRTQLFIETFGRRYSPLVLLASLLLLVIPFLATGSFSDWAIRAVVLLVAAAPCALVMSTPVAVAAGIGNAGRSGILIKGGIHLENLGKIKVVAFDKTGTLTEGRPQVTDVLELSDHNPDSLTLAYSVERLSEHPLAQAVVQKAMQSAVQPLEATGFSALIGSGARATVGGRTVLVGKPELFRDSSLDGRTLREIDGLRDQGKTVILVGVDGRIEGIIALRDQPRPHAARTVEMLGAQGMKIVILTGDSHKTAAAIARELGVDEVRADLTPEAKIEAIGQLESKYGAVAMVGDGINDAPALARATVGIAMGAAGTDAAIEAADAALMADDLMKVPYCLSLGARARRISRQNIAFSMLILAVLVPAALFGAINVAMAVIFHETSELLAVANGLRMARKHVDRRFRRSAFGRHRAAQQS